MSDKAATLKEIRERGRQAGAEWIASAHRSTIEALKGVFLENVLEEMSVRDRGEMRRCTTAFREAGGTPKESSAFLRGLRDGMKQGYADLFKPYLDAERNVG